MEKNKMLDLMIADFKSENLNVQYVQIREGGKVTAEYKRTEKKTRLNMFSVSKSVVSVGAGIAIDEGLIDMNELVCEAFPEYIHKSI